jgi:Domain of unknown function (DUF3943)
MRSPHARPWRRALGTLALALAFATPGAALAEESAAARVLSWETGAGKSYLIPVLEVGGFSAALNLFDRHFVDPKSDYDTDGHTIWKNLRTAPVYDKDPFNINQIGHPYQGGIYYGFARSAGLEYWESLLYTLAGSVLWETAGETTPPSINDHVATGIGGSFVGEAAFRMASLLLERGGERPGFWRELGAALISPPTGFNRLVFGDRFRAVFPSRDPEIFIRLRLGATLTANVTNEGLPSDVKRQEGTVDYSITYGLPGKNGYRYTRPFDHFHFEFTAVPNASTAGNAIENVSIRGLLVGAPYESVDDTYRGVWGLFGIYDYFSPQIFRVADTAVALGTVGQWWISRAVALQGTALAGVGFGAAGTVADREERDYHYGVIPQTLLGLRLVFGDRAMLEATGRHYSVIGTGSGPDGSTSDLDAEIIARGNVGLTVRLWGPHAIGIQYLVSNRDARFHVRPDRHQLVETVSVSYNFLGHTRFGAVEWRGETTGR